MSTRVRRRDCRLIKVFLTLPGVMITMSPNAHALEAKVTSYKGSPMILVNGKPISPLTFFGWEGGGGPTVKEIGTEWKEYSVTFVAPEDNDGHAGIHFRVGGAGPGTVWVDTVQFYPGAKVEDAVGNGRRAVSNWVREGDWEGTKEEISKHWSLFQAKYAGADADWSLDTTTKVTGKQSVRIDIRNAGENTMHLHFYQSGYTVKKGQRYTYSLWMKADKPRTIDFMALHIGDPWTIYNAEETDSVYRQQVKLARGAGIHLVSFGIPMPWPKRDEQPDFVEVDRAIESTLVANPDALLLPRFGMAPPQWWLDEHSDDRMLFDDGKYEDFCVASEDWRREMQEHLRALVRHCEEKYGDHFLGYHPCGQHTGEWFYQRSWEPRLSDFSPAMSRGFAKWVQAKYKTAEALRQAWNNPTITFDQVAVPTKEEQLHTDLGFFRNPVTERKVIDYFEYKQVAMEEPLEMMARVIKEETNRKKLVCFFYGYLFDMHGIPMGPQGSGHLAMARMVKCPDVDILCSPISYLDRELGGAGCFMSAVDTVRTAGKLWLNEDDTRTYLTPKDSGFGRVETPQGTYWVLQRNFGQLWPRRLACWYMDLGGTGWFNGKDIWDNVAPMQRFYQQHINETSKWSPEVALIVDEQSPFYTACTSALHSSLVYQMRSQFFRMGAPFRIHLLSNLVAGKVAPAKAYFFANCFHLDSNQRAAIKQVTRGKTAVWFYGGGFLKDDASEANMQEAIGLKLTRGESQAGKVIPAAIGGKLSEGLSTEFGTDAKLDPLWIVDDTGMEAVGRYANGGVAAAAKKTPEGLRVYIGALHCPAKLLRNILKQSGVHVYSDNDDVVLTDGEFLCLSATSAGSKFLSLPRQCRVTNALDGKLIATRVKQLELKMELGETRVYILR